MAWSGANEVAVQLGNRLARVKYGLFKFGEGCGDVVAQALEVGQFIGGDQTKIKLPGIAEQGDVQQVSGR